MNFPRGKAQVDAPPSFLMDSNVNPNWKQRKTRSRGTLFGSQHFDG
jgi:hypothetical protein